MNNRFSQPTKQPGVYAALLQSDEYVPFSEESFLEVAQAVLVRGSGSYPNRSIPLVQAKNLQEMVQTKSVSCNLELQQLLRIMRITLQKEYDAFRSSFSDAILAPIKEWITWLQVGSLLAGSVGDAARKLVYETNVRENTHSWLQSHLRTGKNFFGYNNGVLVESIPVYLPRFPNAAYICFEIYNGDDHFGPTLKLSQLIGDNDWVIDTISPDLRQIVKLHEQYEILIKPGCPGSFFDDKNSPTDNEIRVILGPVFGAGWNKVIASSMTSSHYLAQFVLPWMSEENQPRPKDSVLIDLLQLGCQQKNSIIPESRLTEISEWVQEKIEESVQ